MKYEMWCLFFASKFLIRIKDKGRPAPFEIYPNTITKVEILLFLIDNYYGFTMELCSRKRDIADIDLTSLFLAVTFFNELGVTPLIN